MKITWSKLTPKDFESLCALILKEMRFTDIKWYGKGGGDKGRDLTAKKEESPLPSIKKSAKWVVQCKRYVKKPPTKREIQAFLDDAIEHKPDHVLIMITNTLSSNTKDWISAADRSRRYPFAIHYFEELDLESEIALYRSEISERLPKILSQAAPVTVENVIKKQQYVFSCRGVDEIEIVAIDKSSEKKAREDVVEFIRFLRANEVTFSWRAKNSGSPKRRSKK